MAKPVTDPALLAQLEAGGDVPGKPVTDPALLEQLEGGAAKPPAAAAPAEETGVLRQIRDAIHAPTRILENGVLLGLGDRARAGMGYLIGEGRPSLAGHVTGEPTGYGGLLKKEQAETDKFEHDHPVGSAAAGIVGGAVAPVAAVGAAAKGASLGAKTIYAALTGGGVGGLQGGLASRDWTDIPQTARDTALGGAGGFILGGALPGAGALIGKGVSSVANAIRGRADGMSRGASNHLVNALEADTPAAVRAELDRLGPDATLADAGPALLGKAQGASLNSDEGRTILFNALKARDQGTNARIMGDVERALGPAEDPVTATKNIVDYRARVDSQNYPRVLDSAPAIRTGPMMAELTDAIASSASGGMEQKALQTLKTMLTRQEKRARLDPVTGRQEFDNAGREIWDTVPVNQDRADVLHKVKGEIDNVIQYDKAGLGVPAGALGNQQFALKKFRHQLNELLEQQVNGYARANAVSGALAKRAEAVERGTQYLGEGKTTPSPGRFQDEFEQLAAGERIALAKGSRGTIDNKLGTKANDLQALRRELQGEGGWNTEKLAIVHGDDAARQLMDTVERNLKFRDTHTKVSENSQTEIRRAAREQMKPEAESKDQPLFGPGSSVPGMITTFAKRYALAPAWRALTHVDPTASYGEVAKILTAQSSARDQHLRAIVDAMNRRGVNNSVASSVGDRSALAAAILANALTNGRSQTPQQ